MNTVDKVFAAFVATILLAVAVAVAVSIFSDNTTEWQQTEDPACVLRVHSDNRVFSPDRVTRVRFCKVES